MADLLEMAKALGKALQQDERYLAFRKAAEDNDKDEKLQELIAAFNRVRALGEEVRALYGDIMGHPTMAVYQGARAEFEQLLDGINRVIAMSAAGQDPDNFDITVAAGCSGDCSGCAGCH